MNLKFDADESESEQQVQGTNWVTVDEFKRIAKREIYKIDWYEMYGNKEASRPTSASDSPLTSWWGDVLIAGPGEEWPYNGSTPFMPLCQFNLTELPSRPESVSDIAMVAIFIDPEDMPIQEYLNGDKWLIRTYSQTGDLVSINKPPLPVWEVEKMQVCWRFVKEFPDLREMMGDTLPILEDCDDWSDYTDFYHELFENRYGTKIGGQPYITNADALTWGPYSNPVNPLDVEYVFQIDSDGGWMWGDVGVGHIGRHRKDRNLWMLTWNCC